MRRSLRRTFFRPEVVGMGREGYLAWDLSIICVQALFLYLPLLHRFMFELLSKINITSSSKDQVLEVLDKCNSLLIGGERDIKSR